MFPNIPEKTKVLWNTDSLDAQGPKVIDAGVVWNGSINWTCMQNIKYQTYESKVMVSLELIVQNLYF